MTSRWRLPLTALISLALTIALGASARADIDLTGDWVIEYDLAPYGGLSTSDESLVQTVSDLAWSGMTGTIDPGTGVFHVEGQPGHMGYPPANEKNGQATADGVRLTGTSKVYVSMAGVFQPVFFAMRGIRADAIVCGNAVRDPGEQCDDGAANGTNDCCDAVCAVVDPDADGLCSAIDNCPDDYNPEQGPLCDDTETFTLTSARILPPKRSDNSQIKIAATLVGSNAAHINAIPSFRIAVDDDYDRTVTDLACIRNNPRTVKCKTSDKTGQVQIDTTKSKGTVLKARFKRAAVPAVPPAVVVGPITVTFIDGTGVPRQAVGATCGPKGSALVCTP